MFFSESKSISEKCQESERIFFFKKKEDYNDMQIMLEVFKDFYFIKT